MALVHRLQRTRDGRQARTGWCIGGIHQPDGGEILLDARPIVLHGAAEARRHGIAVIHQHPAVFPDLSVAENIFVGRQPRRGGRVDWATMQATAAELLLRLRKDIDVRLPVKTLGITERQAIESVKALSLKARVLISRLPLSLR